MMVRTETEERVEVYDFGDQTVSFRNLTEEQYQYCLKWLTDRAISHEHDGTHTWVKPLGITGRQVDELTMELA